MSYDIAIVKKHTIHNYNYTYNIYDMFKEAASKSELDSITSIKVLDGYPCAEVAGILKDIITEMRSDPEHYKTFNPENGWGSYQSFISVLQSIYEDCLDHPDCEFEVT